MVIEEKIVVNGESRPSWLSEQPILTPRKFKIVCIGARYSGLTLAYKVQHELKLENDIEFKIYEKNLEIGGTWCENTYPGAACDIPSHAYMFLFEPNPDWSKFYSPAPEILACIKRTA
ncbi:hypothetical protein IFR05_003990 [Cadophora sp. M221]|nr:hypothetical protein IFR05_003990 [Cadophora sp. M221]